MAGSAAIAALAMMSDRMIVSVFMGSGLMLGVGWDQNTSIKAVALSRICHRTMLCQWIPPSLQVSS